MTRLTRVSLPTPESVPSSRKSTEINFCVPRLEGWGGGGSPRKEDIDQLVSAVHKITEEMVSLKKVVEARTSEISFRSPEPFVQQANFLSPKNSMRTDVSYSPADSLIEETPVKKIAPSSFYTLGLVALAAKKIQRAYRIYGIKRDRRIIGSLLAL